VNSETILQIGGILGGIAAIGQVGFSAWRWKRGGEQRKGQAEAAKAHLDVAQAEAAGPHVAQALELGNIGDAVAVQQGMINGMQDHIRFQDGIIEARDKRIKVLEDRLKERDDRIDELEKRLGLAEDNLNEARRMINAMRSTTQDEQ
jgi:uncharacterized coiled-coil protein SlyX